MIVTQSLFKRHEKWDLLKQFKRCNYLGYGTFRTLCTPPPLPVRLLKISSKHPWQSPPPPHSTPSQTCIDLYGTMLGRRGYERDRVANIKSENLKENVPRFLFSVFCRKMCHGFYFWFLSENVPRFLFSVYLSENVPHFIFLGFLSENVRYQEMWTKIIKTR